ncbi:hypothetical protein E4T44_12688, partial [Aureobasidium sp. EXF-8845]
QQKCDQKRPDCSRCLRLGLKCHGAGERRFKFITNYDQTMITARSDTLRSASMIVLPYSPTDVLAASMVQTMDPSVDLKYNLAWSFPLIEYVPPRLGRSAALDAAARVVVASHSSHCISRHVASPSILSEYSRALKYLVLALDDTSTAQSLETLCAINLLLISQALLGIGNRWSGHGEGASQILKARGHRTVGAQDAFEASILVSLSASLLLEALFNPNIALSPCDWEGLIGNFFDQDHPVCTTMRCVSLVPGHLLRGSQVLHEDPELISAVRTNCQTLQALALASRQSLERIQGLFDVEPSGSIRHAHALYLRTHSLNVAVLVIVNRVRFAIDVTTDSDLSQEAEQLSNEIISLAQEAEQYAPLGSSYVPFSLCAAWIGFSDYDRKTFVENLLLNFYNQNKAAMLVDVLRVKAQELGNLRRYRSASISAASSWSEIHGIGQDPWYGNPRAAGSLTNPSGTIGDVGELS